MESWLMVGISIHLQDSVFMSKMGCKTFWTALWIQFGRHLVIMITSRITYIQTFHSMSACPDMTASIAASPLIQYACLVKATIFSDWKRVTVLAVLDLTTLSCSIFLLSIFLCSSTKIWYRCSCNEYWRPLILLTFIPWNCWHVGVRVL